MPIETRCANCGRILSIAEEHAGKEARCPACGTEYTVPEQTDVAALDSVCDFCGEPIPIDTEESEGPRVCELCLASIEQNQLEMQEEAEARQRWYAGFRPVLQGVGILVILFFLYLLARY